MFVAILWTTLVFLSFGGWGIVVVRLARRRQNADLGLLVSIGLALAVIVGGMLNVTGMVGKISITVLVLSGCFVLTADRVLLRSQAGKQTPATRREPLTSLLLVGLLVLVAIRAIVQGSSFAFNAQDDFQAYSVFPQLMLDTGSSIDPFNGRRLLSGLGGKAFLDAIVLSWLSFQNLRITDGVVGFAALLVSSVAATGVWKVPVSAENRLLKGTAIGLVVATFGILEARTQVNLTSTTTATVMLFTVTRLLASINEKPSIDVSECVVVGICCAAICSFKSTFIPATGFLILTNAAVMSGSISRRATVTAIIVSTLLVALLPWMLVSLKSSGTFLYPILGRGYYSFPEGMTYGEDINWWRLFGKIGLRVLPLGGLLILFVWLIRWPQRALSGEHAAWMALIVGCIAGVTIIGLGAGGDSIIRYSMPLYYACILGVAVTALRTAKVEAISAKIRENGAHVVVGCGFLALSAVCVAISAPTASGYHATSLPRGAWNPFNMPLASAEVMERHLRMQESIPNGAGVLVRMEKPFLLNFRRNRIYTMDLPCAASPSPGVPCVGKAEEIAQYLRNQQVRFIGYDYASDGGYPESIFRLHLDRARFAQTIVVETKYALEFDARLKELFQSYPRIYDDGYAAVIDLGT